MSAVHRKTEGHPGQRDESASQRWVEQELSGCNFTDKRLERRLRTLLAQLASRPGGSIPLACQDWANTKAAYRFFDNARVDESEILEGHFKATRSRLPQTMEPILVLHDTTEFSYRRENTAAIGKTTVTFSGAGKDGRPRLHTVCGILMHSSLVVTCSIVRASQDSRRRWATPRRRPGCGRTAGSTRGARLRGSRLPPDRLHCGATTVARG